MVPVPNLQTLLDVVRTDAPGDDPLVLLGQASRTASELEQLADALLGHFVDQCRRSGRSWSEISAGLGVSKQAAHKRFSGLTPAIDRFTPRANAVLENSAQHAQALGHGYVGTEHLLLALFDSSESVAARMLAEEGITRVACEEQVLARTPRGTGATTGRTPFTPRAVEMLRGAVEESLRSGHTYVGTEHLLLAVFRDPDSMAAQVLISLKASYDDLAAKLAQILASLAKK